MAIAIDDSKWPVLLITFPAEGNEEDVDVFLQKLRTVYARQQPFVTIVDARQVVFSVTHSKLRSMLAQGVNKIGDDFPGFKLGEVVILGSATSRAAMTAGSYLRKRPFKTATAADLDEAVTWARSVLAERP